MPISTTNAAPTHITESISDRRKQRELAEARQAGTAPAEINVSTGAMINPHNPEFITKRPWYLGGGDAGPSLDHQADQRSIADRVEISLAASEALVAQERRRVKEQLRLARQEGVLRRGTWVEALKYNRKPYLMAEIVRVKRKKLSNVQEVDLKFEDGSVEKGVKILPGSKRVKVTKTGTRSFAIDHSIVGKSTYDSKRDAYHGFELEDFTKKTASKFQQRDEIRRKLREEEAAKRLKEEGAEKKKGENGPSDSDDSDYDSDEGDDDSGDEFVQKDEDDKMFTSRLARQGGVGGAQMMVTARNLRIREDTAKYLQNLDCNSAYYDPKSRSMRDNPNPDVPKEEALFAGDNFARVSGDVVALAETQLFAWEASGKGVKEIHPQANPSQAEVLKKQYKEKSSDLKARQKRAVLDKYGGAEYLDGSDGLGSEKASNLQTRAVADRKVRFGVSTKEETYTRDGKKSSSGKEHLYADQKSKYEEDVYINGHKTVWGSYFHKGAFRWGYADDHSLMKNSYCTGLNGRKANDESNEIRYGTGVAGSAAIAQMRSMLVANTRNQNSQSLSSTRPNSSKLYGEADTSVTYDEKKLIAAKEKLLNEKKDKCEGSADDRKRKYNSVGADVDVSAEDMEAWRMTKSRHDDPMNKLGGDELLEYT